jgi:chromate reductase
MSDTLQILGIAGSLRAGSYNRAALRAAGGVVPDGASLSSFGLEDIPPYNQDAEAALPPAVRELKRLVRQADAILFVTPEYNFSVPGVLKNAIDWASRPAGDNAWAGKPAAIMGVSSGRFGTTRSQLHLRQIFVYLDVHCINKPHVMIGNAAEAFDAEGNLADEKTRDLIRQLLANLVEWSRRLRGRP